MPSRPPAREHPADQRSDGLEARLGRPAPPVAAVIGLADSLGLLAEVDPQHACEHHVHAAAAFRAWPKRTAFIEREQTRLDHLASCPR